MRKAIILFLFSVITISGFAKDKLLIGLYNSPPFVNIKSDGTISGVSVDLWKKISNDLGIKYETKLYSDDEINKLITDVQSGYLDMGIGCITINEERLRTVDFSMPYYTTKLGVITEKKHSDWYEVFSAVLTGEFLGILGLLVGILLFLGLVIWLFERRKNPDFPKGWRGIFDGAYFISVVMSTVGFGDKKPITPMGKIITVIWMFIAMGITSLFISSLSSSMTVDKLEGKITSTNDLKKLKVAAIEGTSADLYLTKHEVKHYSYKSSETALDDIAKKELDAYVDDVCMLNNLINQDGFKDKLSISESEFETQYYGIVLKKGESLRETINPLIMKYTKDEDWELMKLKYHLVDKIQK